jgi:hypothetical protein
LTTYPHSLLTITLATGVAWLMMRLGLMKNALELKRKPRTCSACGRINCSCIG